MAGEVALRLPELGELPAPWRLPPGMRFGLLRRALLWLLEPFWGCQSHLNANNAAALDALTRDLESLSRRLDELERRWSDEGDAPPTQGC